MCRYPKRPNDAIGYIGLPHLPSFGGNQIPTRMMNNGETSYVNNDTYVGENAMS